MLDGDLPRELMLDGDLPREYYVMFCGTLPIILKY